MREQIYIERRRNESFDLPGLPVEEKKQRSHLANLITPLSNNSAKNLGKRFTINK